MSALIFKTKQLSEKILISAKERAESFCDRYGRKPTLAVILVGNDAGSEIYVRKKGETCKAYGLNSLDFKMDPSEGFSALVNLVQKLNADDSVDGILVQSPLPKGWDERKIQSTITPQKDVDGFHPKNAGDLFIDSQKTLASGLPACTPAGVMEVLKENGISISGKNAVVVGRSSIVGKPMAMMLLGESATVTICHSQTKDLKSICSSADILVAAIGKPKFITAEFVKHDAVVIDVGINRVVADGKQTVVGDVDAASVSPKASLLTPVPFGIGPMTIAMLIRNTVRAAENRIANPS